MKAVQLFFLATIFSGATLLHLSAMENIELKDQNEEQYDKVLEKNEKYKVDDTDGFEIVEKEKPKDVKPFDLALLDTGEQKQKQILESDPIKDTSVVRDYESELLETVFKDIRCKNLNELLCKHLKIRRLFRISPKKSDDKLIKRKGVIVIHGTKAETNQNFFDPDTKIFKSFLQSMIQISEQSAVFADVMSIIWDGENSDDSRMKAGILIGEFLNRLAASCQSDGEPYYPFIDCYAHSHGGTILVFGGSAFGRSWFPKTKLTAFFLAPVLDKSRYSPKSINFEEVYIIESSEDGVPVLGRLFRNVNLYSISQKIEQHCSKIVEIDCYTHNEAPDHSEIVEVIFCSLFHLIQTLEKSFSDSRIQSLRMDIIPDDFMKKHDAPKILMTLFPRGEEEKKLHEQLPQELLLLNKNNQEKHELMYGKPSRVWSCVDYYILKKWRTMRKIFKVM